MTDSCPDEFHCCICRVTGHMAADYPYSWNRRSSVLRSDNSDTHLQQPSQLSATTAQSSQQSTERSEVISPEQFSQSSDESTQPCQPASKSSESLQLSSDSQSLLSSQQSSLSTQLSQPLSKSCGVDSQALSSQQSLQSFDQPSHSSSNSSEQSRHVAHSHPLQPSQKTLNSSQSTQQSSSGPQSLFAFSPPSARPEMHHGTDSSTPPSSRWIPATFKSSDLELTAVATLQSAELSISNDGSPTLYNESSQATVSQSSQTLQHSPASQHSQSSRPSVKDDDNMGDSPPSIGVTKEIAVAVKESSRPVKKRIG